MKVSFAGFDCQVVVEHFIDSGTPCLVLIHEDQDEQVARGTVCIRGLANDELAIKDYSENSGMLRALLDAGVIEPPHRWQPSGFVNLPICRLTPAATKELLSC